MATVSLKSRDRFDREREFINLKTYKYNGKDQQAGQVFDKSQATTRRLRQLYEARYIRMAQPHEVGEPAGPQMPDFFNMTAEQLRTWMKENGRVPHPRSSQPSLVTKSVRLWQELQGLIPVPAPAGDANGKSDPAGA